MISSLTKYIRPIWYFNIDYNKNQDAPCHFVDFDKLTNCDKKKIVYDSNYSSHDISKLDAAYQMLIKGMIRDGVSLDNNKLTQPTVNDNYRFIKKYYNSGWYLYFLVIRIVSLHNPIKEIKAFIYNFFLERNNIYKDVYNYDIDKYSYKYVANIPLVSVIIPTLNRYKSLDKCLNDLEHQTYNNFEVIIIDQSDEYREDIYKNRKIKIRVEKLNEKKLWKARNIGIKSSKSDYLLFLDDDSSFNANWIESHMKCIEYFRADISAGVSLATIGSSIPKSYSIYRWADQIDTGNVMIRRSVFNLIGLYDAKFEKMRMGDAEFGCRAHINGFRIISNPDASRIHYKVSYGGLRYFKTWDGFRSQNFFSYRPVPSVLYFTRRYFGFKLAILDLLIKVPLSVIPYRYKSNNFLLLTGVLISVLLSPILFIQVFLSWSYASKMIQEGSEIEKEG